MKKFLILALALSLCSCSTPEPVEVPVQVPIPTPSPKYPAPEPEYEALYNFADAFDEHSFYVEVPHLSEDLFRPIEEPTQQSMTEYMNLLHNKLQGEFAPGKVRRDNDVMSFTMRSEDEGAFKYTVSVSDDGTQTARLDIDVRAANRDYERIADNIRRCLFLSITEDNVHIFWDYVDVQEVEGKSKLVMQDRETGDQLSATLSGDTLFMSVIRYIYSPEVDI